MRKLLQKLFSGFVIRMANKYSSRPRRERVHEALTKLFNHILTTPDKKGLLLKFSSADQFIIFSDQHKGARNYADDFTTNEKNYLAALAYYIITSWYVWVTVKNFGKISCQQ